MIIIKLKELLSNLNKTATEASEETGINRNTINALVNQKVDGIKFSTIEKICQTYNIALTDLIELQAPPIDIQRRLYRQEAEMVPFTVWPCMLALSKISIENGGKSYDFGRMDGYFKQNQMVAYWDRGAMNEFARVFYKNYQNSLKFDRYYFDYLAETSKIEAYYDLFYGEEATNFQDSQIMEMMNGINEAYLSFWLKSAFIETFDAGFDRKEIENIAKRHRLNTSEVEALTTPIESSPDAKRRLEFLRLALRLTDSKKEVATQLEQIRPEIEQYKKEYGYYKSNYAQVFQISDQDIISEAEALKENGLLITKEIAGLELASKVKSEKVLKILKKHQLKTNPFYFFQKTSSFREHRNMINLKGFHVMDFILSYLEVKTGVAKKYLKYLSPEEISGSLRGLVSQEVLERRFEAGMLVSIGAEAEGEIKVFESTEAAAIKRDLENEYLKVENQGELIKGYTAFRGYAKGVARVISSQADFSRFNNGDILVTSMTRPDYLPFIEKAGAIVTDEGGVTCSAVLISRELGVPCVIGTRVATSVVKDGDLIEVRAGQGVVRVF